MTETGLLKKVFHPNRISLYGVASTATGVALLSSPSTMPYGIGLIAAGYASDAVDGKVARDYDLKTKEGASLDPLMDKVKNFMVGGYTGFSEIVRGGTFFPIAMGANFLVDYISQKSRGDIGDQLRVAGRCIWDPESCHKDVEIDSKLRANNFGKWKTGIQAATNLGYLASQYFENIDYAAPMLASALVVSAGLGAKGIWDRLKN